VGRSAPFGEVGNRGFVAWIMKRFGPGDQASSFFAGLICIQIGIERDIMGIFEIPKSVYSDELTEHGYRKDGSDAKRK
jgi:hypothetical protein